MRARHLQGKNANQLLKKLENLLKSFLTPSDRPDLTKILRERSKIYDRR